MSAKGVTSRGQRNQLRGIRAPDRAETDVLMSSDGREQLLIPYMVAFEREQFDARALAGRRKASGRWP
jgi:hypothetical protein